MKVAVNGIEALKSASAWVGRIPALTQWAAVEAVNRTVVRTKSIATDEILSRGVNLPPSYIRGKLRALRATMANPVGAIVIRRRAVRLARFGAQQLTTPAPRAKGDRRRGIGKGYKQAGVSVQVSRTRKTTRRAFLMPLNSGNGVGVFVRVGRARKAVEHLYGPSPDQLFSAWRDDNLRRVQDQLATHLGEELRRLLGTHR